METREIGNLGEKIAEGYLKNKGYQILEKNYCVRFISGPQRGEIDIIAEKGETISFVEVKLLRGSSSSIRPEEKVNFQKQRKIVRAAEMWLAEKRIPLDSKWQIDIISINTSPDFKNTKINHFENAIC